MSLQDALSICAQAMQNPQLVQALTSQQQQQQASSTPNTPAPAPSMPFLNAMVAQPQQFQPPQLQQPLYFPQGFPNQPQSFAMLLQQPIGTLERVLGLMQSMQQSVSPQQQYNAPAQSSTGKIEPSDENDAAVASCIREARLAGKTHRFALESMISSHGYTDVLWKDYFLDRHDTIIALVSPLPSPLTTVKMPSFVHRTSTKSPRATQTAVRTAKRGRTSSAPGLSRPRQYSLADEVDDFYVPSEEEEDTKDGEYGKRKRNRAPANVVKPPALVDVPEMSRAKQPVTSGDLDAVAEVYVDIGAEREKVTLNQLYEAVHKKYNMRSPRAWRLVYSRYKQEIHKRVEVIRRKRNNPQRSAQENEDDAELQLQYPEGSETES